MKRLLLKFVLLTGLLLPTLTQAQAGYTSWAEKLGFPKGKKVIILHADDIGMCSEASISAVDYLLKGEIQSAAAMVPCPTFEAFASWAKENPQLDIGLHLTLTSEWKTYRWGPVSQASEVPGLIDQEGKLWRDVPGVVQHASPEEVEKEIRAQIEKAISMGLRPSHIDTHMGTLYGHHAFTAVYTKVAEEYGIPAMVIDFEKEEVVDGFRKAGYPITKEMEQVIKNYRLPKLDFFASAPNGKTYEEKRANFMQLVQSLPAGLTEIIFHPSVLSENLKTITNSWQQRVWEARLFADEEMKNFFKQEGIIFTNWKEIMARFKEKR